MTIWFLSEVSRTERQKKIPKLRNQYYKARKVLMLDVRRDRTLVFFI
ncbi:hypothetical protein [Priestia aryabhattai]|nr:hypothetical protein [Priestia aryabhattai]MDE8674693.1 hypothetical protein [Priestia aryabhattai]